MCLAVYWTGLLNSVELTEKVLPRALWDRPTERTGKYWPYACGKCHSLNKDGGLAGNMQEELDKCWDLLSPVPAGKNKT